VITRPFNEACAQRAREAIDPSLAGKTLVFCVNDAPRRPMVVDCSRRRSTSATAARRGRRGREDHRRRRSPARADPPLPHGPPPLRRGDRRSAHHRHRRAGDRQAGVPAPRAEPDPLRADARPRDASLPRDREGVVSGLRRRRADRAHRRAHRHDPVGGLSEVQRSTARRRARVGPRRARARSGARAVAHEAATQARGPREGRARSLHRGGRHGPPRRSSSTSRRRRPPRPRRGCWSTRRPWGSSTG
jgi:hypothetical protein